jgi:hypothetical protein
MRRKRTLGIITFGRNNLKVEKKIENLDFFQVHFNRKIKLLKFTIFWNVNFSN